MCYILDVNIAVGVIKVNMNPHTFNKGFNTDYSNMGGYTIGVDMGQGEDGVALYSEAHKKPSIVSKWFWIGLYKSIFGFKFSENAVEMVDSADFGSKIKNA